MHPARADLAALAGRGPDLSGTFVRTAGATRGAAVLILFGELDAIPDDDASSKLRDVDLLLLRRAATLRSHAGQVAFPGGGIDPGETPVEAALREAVEETGLDASGVEVLGDLPPVPAMVTGHHVSPVLAWWTRSSQVVAVDHAETVEVYRVPVAELLDPDNRATAVVEFGSRVFTSPAYLVAGTFVWGFTGLLLDRVLDELGWTIPWDEDRRVAVPPEMRGSGPSPRPQSDP